jgi:hypothetical protein
MAIRSLRKRAIAIGGVATMLTTVGLATATTAADAAAAIPVVTVHMSASKITFTGGGASTANGVTTLHAGRIHFHVVTASGDHALQFMRFHNGYTAQQAQNDFNGAFSGDVPAVQRIDHGVVFRGGAEALPKHPGDMVVSLPAAQFMATDQNSNASATLNIVGKAPSRVAQPYSGIYTAFSYGWETTSNLPATGWVRFANRADQPHFLVLQHVKSTTTNKMVRQFIASGAQSNPSWGLKETAESGVVSPSTSQLVHLSLPAGRYLIACFWPDYFTGMPHMFMGMWKLVTLH